MFFNLMGSLGLFLLGMWLLTEGLKLAGGKALENLLGHWTSSRKRGLISGMTITALVQSSTAVTVATLGFVNSGLLTFRRAIWAVFGSNVGTTFTAWIVTIFGFSVKIDAYAFPLIGVGAALRVFYPNPRGKALGMALAGFGLLFMGIDALKTYFTSYAESFDIQTLLNSTDWPTLLALIIGFSLTLLTQSSSAAIAIILTAVASGIIDLDGAAAAVIGANVGTTSTAVIASFGATPNAKRLAWAHVIFNVVTALVALSVLPLFIWLVASIASVSHLQGNLMLMLAIFHTCFNILGVLLMWPIEPRMSHWLLSLYRPSSSIASTRPHLDNNVATIPDLAVRSMTLELKYLMSQITRWSLPHPSGTHSALAENAQLKERIAKLNQFIELAFKSELTNDHSALLGNGLSVSHHLNYARKTYATLQKRLNRIMEEDHLLREYLHPWLSAVNEFNHLLLHEPVESLGKKFGQLQKNYQSIKSHLLRAASEQRLNIEHVDTALQAASFARRFIELMIQANDGYRELTARVIDKSGQPVAGVSDEIMKEA